MTKANKVTITIRGKVITSQQVAAFGKGLAAQSEAITVWANYCAIHAVAHHNIEPLNAMLQNAAFRLSTGKLSKLGGEVAAYIKAHAPQIQLNAETRRYIVARMKADNPRFQKFANPAQLDDAGKPAIVEAADFALTFDEWRTLEKAEKEQKPVTLKASTVTGQIGKVLEAIQQKRLSASVEEADTLLADVLKLQAELVSLTAKLKADVEPIDADKAAELLKSGQSGKSKRAGGKVAAAV
ncbi:hypothetical protein [Stutzerimonas stutzeri]|uniref:hypothetical protein n=1 Tax=Stutzerimonas stutzeri TaxID=316 RepID=UPI0008381F9C|nr:hypothetical protein [Stutzerimonas stutzeri]OCX57190.1 hypothetical protein BFM99_14060 [Stutzerimonas stutzeri]